jgi:hypothetical protein
MGMIDAHMFSQSDTLDRRIERRLNFTQFIIIALLVVVISVPFLIYYWFAQTSDVIRDVEISNVQILGSNELCPGERLSWSFALTVTGTGNLDIDGTSYRISPPSTIVFSNTRRMVVFGDMQELVVDSWLVPVTRVNPASGEAEPFPSGSYLRLIAISSPSRSTIFTKAIVPFTVKAEADCGGK